MHDTHLSPDRNCESCSHCYKLLNKVKSQELQLRCALKGANLGMWTYDLESAMVTISDEVLAITGADPSVFRGGISAIADQIVHASQRETFLNGIKESIDACQIKTMDYRINHPTKALCWVRLQGMIVYNELHQPAKLIGTILDITEDSLSSAQLKTNLDFMEALLAALPNPIFYKDAAGRYRFCNTAFLDTLGLTREAVIDKTVYDVASKDMADIYHQADVSLMESHGTQVYETTLTYGDGTVHDVIFTKAAHLDQHGEPIGLVGMIHDITEKKATERQIRMLHQIKDVFLDINHAIMAYETEEALLHDLLVQIQTIFPACEQSSVLQVVEMTYLKVLTSHGYDPESVTNFQIPLEKSIIWHDVGGAFSKAHIVNDMQCYVSKGFPDIPLTLSGKHVESTLIVPITIGDELKWVFAFDSSSNHVYSEIDKTVADFIREELPLLYRIFELYRKTLLLSRYDVLTGLMNRSYFENTLDDRLKLVARQKKSLLIASFDLDGLKSTNDRYGHEAGDAYLKAFSALLKNTFRESDALSRIGGDEFIGLFNETTQEALAAKILKMRSAFEEEDIRTETLTFRGSFSFGLSIFPDESTDKTTLLRLADLSLYRDKKRTRSIPEPLCDGSPKEMPYET